MKFTLITGLLAAANAQMSVDQIFGLNLQCGDACTTSQECALAGNCNLCLAGTCQHRCLENGTCEESPVEFPFPSNQVLCSLKTCTTYADCGGECNLCLGGQCQHRCMENGTCAEHLEPEVIA